MELSNPLKQPNLVYVKVEVESELGNQPCDPRTLASHIHEFHETKISQYISCLSSQVFCLCNCILQKYLYCSAKEQANCRTEYLPDSWIDSGFYCQPQPKPASQSPAKLWGTYIYVAAAPTCIYVTAAPTYMAAAPEKYQKSL